jgi:TatD DNase family protein
VELETRQRRLCLRFVDLALELDLPLNVHSRSAGRQTIAALLERGARRVQMHAFDGKTTTTRSAVDAGFYFSIPPSIVRSRQKQKLVHHLPLGCLLVESDSPVLGPRAGERTVSFFAAEATCSVPDERCPGVEPLRKCCLRCGTWPHR